MLSEQNKQLVANATVEIVSHDGTRKPIGLAVVGEGGYVITAAHCTKYAVSEDASMAMDSINPQTIKVGSSLLLTSILAVEPVADIAVLGGPNDPELEMMYQKWVWKAARLKLCSVLLAYGAKMNIYIRTHEGKWVDGTASLSLEVASRIDLELNGYIPGGTSGGPIVNESGELVGIVSHSFEEEPYYGSAPFVPLALPVWVVGKIKEE